MSNQTLLGGIVMFAMGCGGIAGSGLDAGDDVTGDVEVIDVTVVNESGTGDTGTAETGSGDSGASFTPASLSNLVLWLDASQLVATDGSGNVTSWGDLSTYKNNATAAMFTAPSVLSSGIDGLPTIHFAPTGSTGQFVQIADAPSLEWGTGDFLVAFVARYTNNPANGDSTGAADFFWKSTFMGQSGSGVSVWGNVPLANQTVVNGFLLLEDEQDYVVSTGAYNDNVGRAFVTRRSGSTMELRVNGTSIATQTQTNTVDVSAPGIPVVMGAIDYAYYLLFGDVSEVVALSGTTSPSDLASLEAYFTTKYAL